MSGAPPLSAHALAVRLGGRTVLDGVELSFRAGEVTAVVGPNGAGKSTLLTCLAGLRRPEGGQTRLGAEEVLALPPRERARRIGFLPQTPEVAWRLDVETLVGLGRIPHAGRFGAGPADRAAVARALEAADAEAFAGREVASLSGGERARVLIARAIAGEPEWLLADEPLTGLDLAHQLEVAALFRRVAREGGGVVLSVHDLSFAARAADRVVLLAGGRLLADGAPLDALTPEALRLAYGVDAVWRDGRAGPLLDVADHRV